MIHSVVADALEEGLPPGEEREIVDAVGDSAIPRHNLLQLRILHEGHKVFHQIKLHQNLEKVLNLHIKVGFNQNSYCMAFDHRADLQVFLFFLKFPPFLVENFFMVIHIFHFSLYLGKKLLLRWAELLINFLSNISIFSSLFVSFVDSVKFICFFYASHLLTKIFLDFLFSRDLLPLLFPTLLCIQHW